MSEDPFPPSGLNLPLSELDFSPPLRFVLKRVLARWGLILLVNALFLMIVFAWIQNPGNVLEGATFLFAFGLAVAYALVGAVTYTSLPARPMYVRKGELYLPRPIRTSSGRVRHLSMVDLSRITPAKHKGLPAINLVLRDGTSFVIPEREIGAEGRRFLEDVGRRLG